MQLVQFYPNRLSITTAKTYRNQDAAISIVNNACRKISNKNLTRQKMSVNLSKTSVRNIKDSIMSMYVLSKPRTVNINSKKKIYNFRQSFITLTLPSKQIHTDVEIKVCLDRFLTILRNNFSVKNYVWKAELQKNKNIHFHITIDKYIQYNALRYYWNQSINRLGYVDRYSDKMQKLSLKDYAKLRNLPIVNCKDVFIRGVRSEWGTPNSVDVVSVRNNNDVSIYLSKYFAKGDDTNIDKDRIKSFGRVWSRSQSLSRLKYKNKIDYNDIKDYINKLVNTTKGAKKVVYDYCVVIYLKLSLIPDSLLKLFNIMIFGNAKMYSYPFL